MLDNRYLQDDTLEKGYYNEGIIGSKEFTSKILEHKNSIITKMGIIYIT